MRLSHTRFYDYTGKIKLFIKIAQVAELIKLYSQQVIAYQEIEKASIEFKH